MSTDRAVARRAWRQQRTGAVVVGLVTAVSVYATATAYLRTYPTAALRQQAAAVVGADSGLRILLGPINDIATVGGYTVYKNFVFLTLLGAVWAVLAGTRVLRGEEDAGRWQLQLAGATTPARATGATLAGLFAAVGLVGALGAAGALACTTDPALGMGATGAFLHASTLLAVPAVFAAVGALASQLARTRRTATGLGLGVVAAAFVLRMGADAGPSSAWLGWLTPFGWVERVRPYTSDDGRPLLLCVLAVAVLATLTVWAAGRRDVGDGLVAAREERPVRARGLGSALGLSLRLELPTLVAWVTGAVVTGFVMGIFAEVVRAAFPASMEEMLARYGVRGTPLQEFLGIAFLLLATVVALLPAAQVGAAVGEQTSGRLTAVLAAAVDRRAWFGGRLALTAGAVVVSEVLGAAGVLAGAALRGLDVGAGSLLGAGLNVVPTALVALGVGAVVVSLAPRLAAPAVYAVVVWSVFADLLAPLSGALEPLQKVSLFHTMALLPGADPDPVAIAVTTLVGLGLCTVAVVAFGRRDLAAD